MNDKVATPKTAVLPQAKKKLAARKAAPRKSPAGTLAAKAVKVVPAQEKKLKKAKDVDNKVKLVRDSFSMPKNDYAIIGELKELCLKSGMQVKKSELLRVGLHALAKLSTTQLKAALSGLEKIEPGKLKKS